MPGSARNKKHLMLDFVPHKTSGRGRRPPTHEAPTVFNFRLWILERVYRRQRVWFYIGDRIQPLTGEEEYE